MAGLEIIVKGKTRPATVKRRIDTIIDYDGNAAFEYREEHAFVHMCAACESNRMVCEFEDGSLSAVPIEDIRFLDSKESFDTTIWDALEPHRIESNDSELTS